ncbi:phage/plasmid primase, P4 family [Ralstonia pseudosolanacearum]|uniref:phage/plasmid primase, P4 family n=1 Tax=Ralstonia pseudosolanacearum TaxID=1310165 RepID=UPI0026753377|nr:phage/plasmid primase, P4 family [Ralstonia pseudosolanacearum]MDO3620223.1 phage/plasmid primase, P4 family [Ralstonia pseudosolanacearum]
MSATIQTHADVVGQFRDAMAEQGIVIIGEIVADGRLHRYHVDGDKRGQRNAWAILHIDDKPAGAFGCNRRYGNDHKFTWTGKATKPLTAAERRAIRERIEKQKQEREEAERARRAAAAALAQQIWDAASECTEHPYLTRKQIQSHGLRVGKWEKIDEETGDVRLISKHALLIPIRDAKKQVHSLQAIFPRKLMGDRDKDYLKDGAKEGLFYSIGKPQMVDGKAVIIICEGYATGASLHEATGHAVIVAFDAPNLLPVAQVIRARFPDATIIMAADNDQWTLKPVNNPGVTRAREAALAVGGLVAVPPFEHSAGSQDEEGKWSGPNDFNDLHLLEGADAVRSVIDDTLEQARPNRVVLLPTDEDALGAAYADDCLHRIEAVIAARDGQLACRPTLFIAHGGEIERAAALARKAYPAAALRILVGDDDRTEAERVGALHGASVAVAPDGARWGELLVDGLFAAIEARADVDAASADAAAGAVARASALQANAAPQDDGETAAGAVSFGAAADQFPLLDKDDPMSSARTMIAMRYAERGLPTLVHTREQFYEWAGSYYAQVEDGAMRSTVWSFLDAARTLKADKQTGEPEKFKPTRSKVADVLEALKAVTEQPGASGTRWLRGTDMPPPRELLPCANGLLHLKTGRLIPSTPDYFCVNASAVAYDADAPEPKEWLAFLDQVLHSDAAAIRELQKLFGYLLTQDYRHQKIFLLIGPPRSGKGTVARILTALLGAGNVATPQLSSLAGPFGLMQFIDKSLAVFGDARTASMDSVARARAVEVLLGISGGDAMSINRKNRDFLNCVLPTRMVILSNEVPNLPDASTALASRFVVIEFKESFLGREDTELGDRLLTELSGILNWAAQGWLELEKDGQFSTPESARQASEQLRAASSPITEFVNECCEIGREHSVTRDTIHDAYLRWCEAEGIKQPRTKGWFVRDLKAAYTSLSVGYHGGDAIFGIGLRTSASVSDMYRPRGGWKHQSGYETF